MRDDFDAESRSVERLARNSAPDALYELGAAGTPLLSAKMNSSPADAGSPTNSSKPAEPEPNRSGWPDSYAPTPRRSASAA
ncbi:MAG: hypothetical protein R2706_17725 [Acidimicrobiales bacterium]